MINEIINKLEDKTDKNSYHKLSVIPSDQLFNYVTIIIITIFISSRFTAQANLIIGLIFGLIVSYFIYQKDISEKETHDEQIKIKLSSIVPAPKYFDNYEDVISFFYSIREFYPINPRGFSDLVLSTDSFLKIHQDSKIGLNYCKQNYDIALDLYKKSLNHMSELYYSTEPYKMKVVKIKIESATDILKQILDKYLEEIRRVCNKEIIDKGIDYNKSKIWMGPKAKNFYDKSDLY